MTKDFISTFLLDCISMLLWQSTCVALCCLVSQGEARELI